MIAHLRGTLLSKSPSQALLECAGVGYDVAISVATFSALPREGAEAKLHIFTKVAEDQLALYGFHDLNEKRLFERLLTISGIGPRLAITVLSGIDADRLVTAIRAADHAPARQNSPASAKRLRSASSSSSKTNSTTSPSLPPSPPTSLLAPHADDALSALINLGYPRPIAQKAIESALKSHPESASDFEQLFRAAMQNIR